MGLLDFFWQKKYSVTLSSVSKKLKISEDSIISILRVAGFEVFNMPFILLNEKHLEILSKAYVDAVKRFYTSSSKNFFSLNKHEQFEMKNFFLNFVAIDSRYNSYSTNSISNEIFKSKLDSNLIKDFFYSLIDEIEFEEGFYDPFFSKSKSVGHAVNDVFVKIFYKIKLKTKSTFNNIKSKLFSIILNCHYYIFSDDENHSIRDSLKSCFSWVINISREALKNINYLKFQIEWKKLNYL